MVRSCLGARGMRSGDYSVAGFAKRLRRPQPGCPPRRFGDTAPLSAGRLSECLLRLLFPANVPRTSSLAGSVLDRATRCNSPAGADSVGDEDPALGPTDAFSIQFTKLEYSHTPQKADGSLDVPIKWSWDLKANK